MASVPDVAESCAKILVPFLGFLRGPSPRRPAVEEAVVSLLVVLPTAYLAYVIVEHFAVVVLAYLHLAAPASATAASSMCLWQFVLLLFALVCAWLVIFAVLLVAFDFLRRRYARDWAELEA
jgi:hypothetical protein